MSREENIAIIYRQIEEVWNHASSEALAAYWDERLLVEMKETHTMLPTAFPDLHFLVADLVAENDKVVARLHFRGTHLGPLLGIPPTGKEIQ